LRHFMTQKTTLCAMPSLKLSDYVPHPCGT
jgi:hypothetical protein